MSYRLALIVLLWWWLAAVALLRCISTVTVGPKPRQQGTSRNHLQKQIAAEKPPDDGLDLACVEVHSVCRGSASISNDPCAEQSPFVDKAALSPAAANESSSRVVDWWHMCGMLAVEGGWLTWLLAAEVVVPRAARRTPCTTTSDLSHGGAAGHRSRRFLIGWSPWNAAEMEQAYPVGMG